MAWFTFTVPLGNRTLFQHLRAIASTPEAQSLGEAARDEAAKMAERVRQGLAPEGDGGAATGGAGNRTRGDATGKGSGEARDRQAPTDQLGDEDRKALDRMVHERTGGSGTTKPPGTTH